MSAERRGLFGEEEKEGITEEEAGCGPGENGRDAGAGVECGRCGGWGDVEEEGVCGVREWIVKRMYECIFMHLDEDI